MQFVKKNSGPEAYEKDKFILLAYQEEDVGKIISLAISYQEEIVVHVAKQAKTYTVVKKNQLFKDLSMTFVLKMQFHYCLYDLAWC